MTQRMILLLVSLTVMMGYARDRVIIDAERLGLDNRQNAAAQSDYIAELFFEEFLKGTLRNHTLEASPIPAKTLAAIKIELAVQHQETLLEAEAKRGKRGDRETVARLVASRRILAEAFRESGLFDKAIDAYDTLSVLTQGTALEIETLAHKASVYRSLGDHDRETDLLMEAASHASFLDSPDPVDLANHFQIQRRLARNLEARGDVALARDAFEKIFTEAVRLSYFDDQMRHDLEALERFPSASHRKNASRPDLEHLAQISRAQVAPTETRHLIEETAERNLYLMVQKWRAQR